MPRKSGASSTHLSRCWIRDRRISQPPQGPMKLSELLTGLASLDARTGAVEAAGVTADSRKIRHGDVFVAVPGTKADGLAYAAQAAAAGAAGIEGEGVPSALP